jgi:hypothetical protein
VDKTEALSIISCLRNGIPPETQVRRLTVNHDSRIERCITDLIGQDSTALLIEANSGSGKTHYLRLIAEIAKENGCIISLVTLDSSSAVKLNRMDQIVGAVFRGIEIPGVTGTGIRPFMDMLSEKISEARFRRDPHEFWTCLTNDWRWDATDLLQSPSLYIALRAWSNGGAEEKDLIEDWLNYPWNYYENRKLLGRKLVEDMKSYFIDPRSPRMLYSITEGIFNFQIPRYVQSWSALSDLKVLARKGGFNNFIILFDEVEDIIYNLDNLKWQKIAFKNMFRFFSKDGPAIPSCFAVTPDFEEKCRELLISRDSWSEEFAPLESLSRIRINPLGTEELKNLAEKISELYGIAYGYSDQMNGTMNDLHGLESVSPLGDRTRQTVKAVVEHLDQVFEDAQ